MSTGEQLLFVGGPEHGVTRAVEAGSSAYKVLTRHSSPEPGGEPWYGEEMYYRRRVGFAFGAQRDVMVHPSVKDPMADLKDILFVQWLHTPRE